MGLIRKSLMIGSVGLVRGSSKKQRVAKAQLNELKSQTKILAEQQQEQRQEQRRQARIEPRQPVVIDGTHEQRMRALDEIRAAAAANGATGVEASMLRWQAIQAHGMGGPEPVPASAQQPRPVELPPEGWYPDADREHLLRWWDGQAWTDRTAPRV